MACRVATCEHCVTGAHVEHDRRPVALVARCCRKHLKVLATCVSALARPLPTVSLDVDGCDDALGSDVSASAGVVEAGRVVAYLEAELLRLSPGGARESAGLAAADALYDAIVAEAARRRDELKEGVRATTAATASAVDAELVAARAACAAAESSASALLRGAAELSDASVLSEVFSPEGGTGGGGRLLRDADAWRQRLACLRWSRQALEEPRSDGPAPLADAATVDWSVAAVRLALQRVGRIRGEGRSAVNADEESRGVSPPPASAAPGRHGSLPKTHSTSTSGDALSARSVTPGLSTHSWSPTHAQLHPPPQQQPHAQQQQQDPPRGAALPPRVQLHAAAPVFAPGSVGPQRGTPPVGYPPYEPPPPQQLLLPLQQYYGGSAGDSASTVVYLTPQQQQQLLGRPGGVHPGSGPGYDEVGVGGGGGGEATSPRTRLQAAAEATRPLGPTASVTAA